MVYIYKHSKYVIFLIITNFVSSVDVFKNNCIRRTTYKCGVYILNQLFLTIFLPVGKGIIYKLS